MITASSGGEDSLLQFACDQKCPPILQAAETDNP
jgi:hypothetical protein